MTAWFDIYIRIPLLQRLAGLILALLPKDQGMKGARLLLERFRVQLGYRQAILLGKATTPPTLEATHDDTMPQPPDGTDGQLDNITHTTEPQPDEDAVIRATKERSAAIVKQDHYDAKAAGDPPYPNKVR